MITEGYLNYNNKYHVIFLKSGKNVLIHIVGTAWLARYENGRIIFPVGEDTTGNMTHYLSVCMMVLLLILPVT